MSTLIAVILFAAVVGLLIWAYNMGARDTALDIEHYKDLARTWEENHHRAEAQRETVIANALRSVESERCAAARNRGKLTHALEIARQRITYLENGNAVLQAELARVNATRKLQNASLLACYEHAAVGLGIQRPPQTHTADGPGDNAGEDGSILPFSAGSGDSHEHDPAA